MHPLLAGPFQDGPGHVWCADLEQQPECHMGEGSWGSGRCLRSDFATHAWPTAKDSDPGVHAQTAAGASRWPVPTVLAAGRVRSALPSHPPELLEETGM